MKQFTKHPKGAQSADECQKWIDYDMEHYGRISEQTMKDIKKAGFTVTKDQYGEYEVTAAVNCSNLSHDVDEYQKWIDYDMKRYGKISNLTMKKIKDAGFTVTKDQYGDYEITASCDVKADTVKKGNKWVNRGNTGEEHGEFDTKKEADAQRRAMYAGGYKGPVKSACGRKITKYPKSVKTSVDDQYQYPEEMPKLGNTVLRNLPKLISRAKNVKDETDMYTVVNDFEPLFPDRADKYYEMIDIYPPEEIGLQLAEELQELYDRYLPRT